MSWIYHLKSQPLYCPAFLVLRKIIYPPSTPNLSCPCVAYGLTKTKVNQDSDQNNIMKKSLLLSLFLTSCGGPPYHKTADHTDVDQQAGIPTVQLCHASHQLLISGWSKEQVDKTWGKHISIKEDFCQPTYGIPQKIPDADEQWTYTLQLGTRLIWFSKGKVVLAIEEWSDW